MERSNRILSIDAFRGITIAGMVLVNLPGSWSHLYPPLRHASWHGWTPTDFVFPFFLFAIGASMSFSFARRKEGGLLDLRLHILKRSAVLFGLGLLLNAFPKFQWEGLRIPGVLQRIALAYLLAALLCTTRLRWKGLLWASAGLLLAYWFAMSCIPVPGVGAGVLTAKGNFGAYVDRLLLDGHLYRKMWDPEGLLGTLPSAVNILLGVLSGLYLQSAGEKSEIANGTFVGGWVLIGLGLVWSIWFPINKKLWTSSYVLFSTGCALQLLGVCYWCLEIKGWVRWFRPALVFGANALALYFLHILYIKIIRVVIRFPLGNGKTRSLYHAIYLEAFASWAGPLNGSLYFALAHVLLWWGVLWWMAKKKIFIKI